MQSYDSSGFEKPSVTVDMLIFTVVDEEVDNYRKLSQKALKILMVRRGDHPFIGQWALPGGFVLLNESLDEAAARTLKRETGIENIYMEQLYSWGDVKRDPRARVISCSYLALVDREDVSVHAGAEMADAQWFHVQDQLTEEARKITETGFIHEKLIKLELWNDRTKLVATIKWTKTVEGKRSRVDTEIVEANHIAFDHTRMIHYAIERLRNKIEYTDIAFPLMPELFTLTELQQVYEVILGKELLAAAFRRKIADRVIETNQYRKHAGHRPSKLYRFNANWENERRE